MPILVDLHPLVISAVAVNLKEESENPNLKKLIKHMFFNMVLSFKKRFSDEYGELIICSDSKNYWRKDFFKYYKEDRDKTSSDLPWDYIRESLDEIKQELRSVFRFKFIEVEKAEADDVIGVISRHLATNDLIQNGLCEEAQPILIVSGDGDFYQLHKYKNIRQWSPRFKKFVGPTNVYEHLIEHIVKAGDDGIPNILSADDSKVNKIRQVAINKAYLQRFIDDGEDACTTELERRNWKRNRTLVDFEYIPQHIYDNIVTTYQTYEIKGSKSKVMNYFMVNRMKELLAEINHF